MKDDDSEPHGQMKLITVRVPDALRVLGIGKSKLYQLIAAREIEVIKVGRITVIPVESLHEFVGRAKRSNST